MRNILVVAAAALLMGNTIEVGHGPRLIRPHSLEVGTEITAAKDIPAISADVLELDSIVLDEPLEFRQALLAVTLPAGTRLGSFITLKSKQWDRNVQVYCSLRLEMLLGGTKEFPPGFSRKYPREQRLCFFRNEASGMLDHAFVASGKGSYTGIIPIEPVRTSRSEGPQATGVTVDLELADVWQKGKLGARAKFVLEFNGADGLIEGRRIDWKSKTDEGYTLWLTVTGEEKEPLPESFQNMLGVYDLTVLSADSKNDTAILRVDAVHEPVMFIDSSGSYQMRTLYITY